ncbi:tetratricopeptide repeat protein [Fictibacillus gelatini]|uniref:tetratricopeptide repeat protein n=1 Tax=Fictibacillus gelatini TaxID=225985 RepID=UPI000414387E|nr:hypothetical protein [Fictibacillus gelatini]
MKKSKNEKGNDKIVHFPNLSKRLIEKGMAALKAKQFKEALVCFNQLLQSDSGHPQGNLGAVLSLIELGELHEAKKRCERMLKQGIGEYFDVLQIYLSILVQLSEYETVVASIEAVLEEQKLPASQAESFYQLLHFGRKMLEQPNEHKLDTTGKKAVATEEIEQLEKMLYNEEIHTEWIAVQQLSHYDDQVILPIFREFLRSTSGHPAVKTMILQYFKDNEIREKLIIHKFGQTLEFDTERLYNIYENSFNAGVKEKIEDLLEHENPTLAEFALTIWWDYVLALYPLMPEPQNVLLWAAALYKAAVELSGMEWTDEDYEKFQIERRMIDQTAEKLRNSLMSKR